MNRPKTKSPADSPRGKLQRALAPKRCQLCGGDPSPAEAIREVVGRNAAGRFDRVDLTPEGVRKWREANGLEVHHETV